MRRPVVIANWKMNGNQDLVSTLLPEILSVEAGTEVVVCPSHVHLSQAAKILESQSVKLGAQNVDWHEDGAYTGEVSTNMLRDLGCSDCIVGHSERRTIFGDTDEIVAKRFKACLEAGLRPILCLGESQTERAAGETENIVGMQLHSVLDNYSAEQLENIVIAYEPIWAIGTGETASPEQAESVHAFIRGILASKDEKLASTTAILYGGSVNEKNAASLFEMENIDGALVGGASLKANAFIDICKFANNRN